MPYLSLQPPPGRTINDSIQFESMDLYFWTDSGFRLPSMLFYAGPIYHEERDAIESAVGVNEEVKKYIKISCVRNFIGIVKEQY